MARYLLDTNVLVYLLLKEKHNISSETDGIIYNYSNQLFTSSIVVMEVLQLFRIGKIKLKGYKTESALLDGVENDFYIKILPFAKQHTQTLAKLKTAAGHNDPFDHAIISHAITDKLILVSSDRQFINYTKQNLNFAFNKR